MIITETFERCTFRVQAARATSKNLDEIAEWCGGRIVSGDFGRTHVMVPTGLDRQSLAPAFVGNWVTCLEKGKSFRVYKERNFHEAFRPVMSPEEKYARVHEHLLRVARAQDRATFHGEPSDEVLLLIEKTAHELCKIV